MATRRLDALLAERGLFESRSKAAAAVMAGDVLLGVGRRAAAKPSEMVADDVLVAVRRRPRYVSRGGVKLEGALASSGLGVAGRRAIDVGASTGGFTDCLLQAGASEVVALDVAYGQLDYRLRTDRRVHVVERTNGRSIEPQMLPYRPSVAVIDVSFISLLKVLPALIGCLEGRHDIMALVKPQFEVGREKVGKGGVVREAADRRAAVVDVANGAIRLGESLLGIFPSQLPGPKGNRECFIWLAELGRIGGVDAAERVEAIVLAKDL